MEKEVQGAKRMVARRGDGSRSGGMEGWGWERWERTPRARFAPVFEEGMGVRVSDRCSS